MVTKKETERAEALARLREHVGIQAGDTIYTSLVHRSRSGMSRDYRVYAIKPNDAGECVPWWITYNVAEAIGAAHSQNGDALRVGGCGFDGGFDICYRLGLALFPSGFDCIGDRCQSNDHSNATLPIGARVRPTSANGRGAPGTVTAQHHGADRGTVSVDWGSRSVYATVQRVSSLAVVECRHESGGYALKHSTI